MRLMTRQTRRCERLQVQKLCLTPLRDLRVARLTVLNSSENTKGDDKAAGGSFSLPIPLYLSYSTL